MLRSSGAAVLGAVRVIGGGLLVNPPRLPELRPPPARASASVATSASAANAASPSTSGRKRKRSDVMGFPLRIARRVGRAGTADILVRQSRILRAIA